MLLSGVNGADFAVVSVQDERDLSLYLFQNKEFHCLDQRKIEIPQNLTAIIPRGTTEGRALVIIVLGYDDHLSVIGFDLFERSLVFVKSSSKYPFLALFTSVVPHHATEHLLLSTSHSLHIFAPHHSSDSFSLQNLTLKVASSKRSVNRETVIFASVFSVSSRSSGVVLISQSRLLLHHPISSLTQIRRRASLNWSGVNWIHRPARSRCSTPLICRTLGHHSLPS
jgi:hypothetical protein